MITPSYNVTATERVLPRLALDFTTASLDSRVTISRALNTATSVNSSGYIAIVNADLPRFDYDPVTKICRGLLIEEARTNICTYSESFQNPPWSGSNVVLTPNSGLAPDGTNNATNLTFNTTGAFMSRVTSIPISASTTYTHSIYLRATSGTFKTKISRTNGLTWATATVSPELTLTTTWQRFDITYTSGAADTVSDFIVGAESKTPYTMPATGTIQVYAAQVEAGAFPTSYIPTTTTSLTRNADVVSMTGTNFSDWYNAAEGAFVASLTVPVISGGRYLFAATDGTINNEIAPRIAGGSAVISAVNTGGVGQASMTVGTILADTVSQVSFAYKENNFASAFNGAVAQTDTSGTVPTVDRLIIGARTASVNYVNGYIRSIRYYPQRLTDAETRAFSK